ncbi:MAG: hypothetical protein ACE5LG_04905 [Anaerolineae bacterium]
MVEEFERDIEAFTQEETREFYLVGAGLKKELELAPIYERYAHLFSLDAVKRTLDQAIDKRRRYIAEFLTLGYLENKVKSLTEEITNAMLRATVEWDGEEIPYLNLPLLIANEARMERRHRLDELRREVTATANPERRERWGELHSEAEGLGFPNYVTLCDQLRGLSLAWLSEQMQTLLDETGEIYFSHLGFFLDSMGVPEAEATTADIAYLFRAPQFDTFFPQGQMIPSLVKTLAGVGIDLYRQENLELDTEPRPLKSPRAFCAPIRVPEEVKLVIKPQGGREDYESLFHEAGHAEHFVNTRADLPTAFRRMGDNSVTEGYAFLLAYLMINRRWLSRILGVEGGGEYLRLALFSKLYFLRRYASKLLYEQELHTDLAGAEKRYVSILGENLGVKIGPEYYLDDVDDAFYVAQYLRAWIFEVQMHRYLEERFGYLWFTSPEAGRYLVSLWQQGQEFTVDELAADMGYEGLDIGPLLEELTSF